MGLRRVHLRVHDGRIRRPERKHRRRVERLLQIGCRLRPLQLLLGMARRGRVHVRKCVSPNITNQDFFRIHTFRDFSIYEEEARRMTIVCSDKDAKVSSEYLSVNEWVLVRELDASRRRKLHDMTDVDEVARQLKRDVPRMSTVNTMKFAERTHAAQPFEWEYGMPSEWSNVY